jgi:hypothetical protein
MMLLLTMMMFEIGEEMKKAKHIHILMAGGR